MSQWKMLMKKQKINKPTSIIIKDSEQGMENDKKVKEKNKDAKKDRSWQKLR